MSRRTGLWIVGAYGGVATTVAVGLSALKQQRTRPFGLVGELPQFSGLDLVDWNSIVLGGSDIRCSDTVAEAAKLASGSQPVITPEMADSCAQDLAEFSSRISPGIVFNCGPAIESLAEPSCFISAKSARAAVDSISATLKEFKQTNDCESVVVINLASTEPAIETDSIPADWTSLANALKEPDCPLPASCLYAIAAIDQGMPFVNFTPSLANGLPAIEQLAIERKTCHMGHDGKTGETLIKSVLAPAFAKRNLEVMSWVGHNIFGNMDGQILDDPANKQTKVSSKNRMLDQILGYEPQSHISIEYIQSLGDWKTAWDHIHFRGFLGTPMAMQFTWQGCDSILAAPLVIDLLRFTELAKRRGEIGVLKSLGSFFKSPMHCDNHDFAVQFTELLDWAGC